MTSGNLSDEPQVIDDDDARTRLLGIAPYALIHNRAIANRVDDSVVRFMAGAPRLLRRARGYAPAPIRLPEGLEAAPQILALGGELKATFCLVKNGEAVLSQHQGDLEDLATYDDYCRNLALYTELFDHQPAALVADRHPEYLSTKLARARAATERLPLIEVQHHHAHVAACLAENGYPLSARPVLGIVLDGLGYGGDDAPGGTIWGGEFLSADYRGYERLGTFKPVAMPGGAQAVREPWRNLYAHLMAGMGWAQLSAEFSELELHQRLAVRPRATLDAMIRNGINSPLASSCGRLFDAVAAALGISFERQAYEGEAAAKLEALVDERHSSRRGRGARLSVRDRQSPRQRAPRDRSARDVECAARRSDAEDACAGHRGALPQRSRHCGYRDGAEARAPRRRDRPALRHGGALRRLLPESRALRGNPRPPSGGRISRAFAFPRSRERRRAWRSARRRSPPRRSSRKTPTRRKETRNVPRHSRPDRQDRR